MHLVRSMAAAAAPAAQGRARSAALALAAAFSLPPPPSAAHLRFRLCVRSGRLSPLLFHRWCAAAASAAAVKSCSKREEGRGETQLTSLKPNSIFHSLPLPPAACPAETPR